MEYIWIAKHRNMVANHTWDPREKNSNSCAHVAAPFAALHHFTAPSPPHLDLELGELAAGSETYFAEDVSGRRVPFLHLTQPPHAPVPDVPPLQEDAEALWRDARQAGPGAHPVRVHHRERRHWAAVRPRRGKHTRLQSPNFIQLMPRSSCAAPSFAAATFIRDICSSNWEFVTFKPFVVWLMHYSHVLCTNSPIRRTIALRAQTLEQHWLCSLSCFAPPHWGGTPLLLSQVEIPNIQKQRKHLAKLVLDMDSARTRWVCFTVFCWAARWERVSVPWWIDRRCSFPPTAPLLCCDNVCIDLPKLFTLQSAASGKEINNQPN